MSEFNTAAAKLLALGAVRCVMGWALTMAVSHGLCSADWIASHIKTILFLNGAAVWGVIELEAFAFRKWGLDIPAIIAKLRGFAADAASGGVPTVADVDKSALPSKEEIKPADGQKVETKP